MAKPYRTPHAPSVSRVLRKAGFRMHGGRMFTDSGLVVSRGRREGTVEVDSNQMHAERAQMVVDVLGEAGYRAVRENTYVVAH